MTLSKSLIALSLGALVLSQGATSPFAKVTRFERQIQYRMMASMQWLPAKLGHLLSAGDALRTGPNSRAEVSYLDGTVARLGPRAILVLDQFRRRGARPGFGRFLAGSIWLRIAKGQRAEIVTPAAVAAVVGTEFCLDVAESQSTKIICLEGAVDFTGTMGDTVRVKGGFWGEAIPGKTLNPPQPITPDAVELAKALGAPLPESVTP